MSADEESRRSRQLRLDAIRDWFVRTLAENGTLTMSYPAIAAAAGLPGRGGDVLSALSDLLDWEVYPDGYGTRDLPVGYGREEAEGPKSPYTYRLKIGADEFRELAAKFRHVPEGYRSNPEALAELGYDGVEWSTDNIVRLLRSRSCAPGALWVGQDWGDDHGHTDCWVHGLAAARLEALEAEVAELRATRVKIVKVGRGQLTPIDESDIDHDAYPDDRA